MPSFIIIFLSRDTALSGFSFRRIFTVNMVLFWVGVCAAALQQLASVQTLHEYCTTTCQVCQVVHRKYLVRPVKLLAAVCSRRAVPPLLGGALVCVRWGMDVGELRGGGLR